MRNTTLTPEVIAKYKNDVFVESGTADGAGVLRAIFAGFKIIYSIEIDVDRQKRNLRRFKGYDNVILLAGDSSRLLQGIVTGLKAPATFWLDAHYEKRGPCGERKCPLYDELYAIATSPLKDQHTIMIDDVRMIGKRKWGKGIDMAMLTHKLAMINPKGRIIYEDNTMAKKDVMVLTP